MIAMPEHRPGNASAPAENSPNRSGSLAGLVTRSVVGLLTVVALMAWIARTYAPAAPKTPSGIPALASATLVDGSTIDVVAVTVEQRHRLDIPRRADFGWDRWLGRTVNETLKINGKRRSVQVWLIRRRPGAPRMVAFDTLRQARIEPRPGQHLTDTLVTAFVHGPYATNSTSGRPPLKMHSSLDADDVVATAVEFPLFEDFGRPARLELLGDSGKLLGAVDVPIPAKLMPAREAWTPQSLPQTVADGPFSATLVELTSQPKRGGGVQLHFVTRYSRGADRVLARPDKVGPLVDPLGNSSTILDCQLDPAEPAWKLPVSQWLRDDPRTNPNAVWISPPIPVPSGAATTEGARHGTFCGGRIHVRFDRLCAAKAPPQILPPLAMTNHNPIKKWRFAGTNGTVSTRTGPGGTTLHVEGDHPYLVAEFTGITASEQPVAVAVQDDLGRDVKFEALTLHHALVCFSKPLPDARSLSFTFGVEQSAKFEFVFAPPRLSTTPSAVSE
jgi:hypothetical protein